ncbi:MAG: hypothetical protein EXS47_01750 [Candidatus Zambryskibacteria bacterium]|nr:hypothetical protein [Candidatus Zambryskibacteria bacterium]
MNKGKKNLFSGAVLFVLFGLIAYYIYYDSNRNGKPITTSGSSDIASTSQGSVQIEMDKASSDKGYKVENLDSGIKGGTKFSVKTPDLNSPIVDHGNLDPAALKVITENIRTMSKNLASNPHDEDLWLRLGIHRKMLRDYEEAVLILNYVVKLWPNDYVPYNNLADLYQSYIKNNELAEKNWLKVIELKADYISAYENLSNLYLTAYPEKKNLALPLLMKGLERNSHSTDLLIIVARYYGALENKEQLSLYYSKAIEEAKLQGNQSLIAALEAELVGYTK